MDTAITFPKDFQNFLVVGLVEGRLLSDARSSQGLNGLVVTGPNTAHSFACTFFLEDSFSPISLLVDIFP